MSVILAGTGCGSLGSMTDEVKQAIEKADLLIGAQRLLDSIPSQWGGRRKPAIYAAEILEIIQNEQAACDGSATDRKNICVLYSGDSGFYSGTRSLVPLLKEAGIDAAVLPGISSIQLFAARLQEPWQDWSLVSAHGTDCDAVSQVCQGRPVFFLTGGKLGPADLCQQLTEAGLGDLEVTVGERLSYEDERICTGTAGEFAAEAFAPLSVMLVRPAPTLGDLTPGIADDAFIRGSVPMTKRDVRAAVLSHMKVKKDDVIWDVGSGTGSVSIELAMKATGGKVYAIERNEEGVALLEENRRKFGTWNVISVKGSAPEALKDLPAPNRVFIGGSSGNLKEIIDAVLDKNPSALLCVTAIALETLQKATEHMTACGMDLDIVQISANKAREVGSVHMMMAENPIYIITGQRPQQEESND